MITAPWNSSAMRRSAVPGGVLHSRAPVRTPPSRKRGRGSCKTVGQAHERKGRRRDKVAQNSRCPHACSPPNHHVHDQRKAKRLWHRCEPATEHKSDTSAARLEQQPTAQLRLSARCRHHSSTANQHMIAALPTAAPHKRGPGAAITAAGHRFASKYCARLHAGQRLARPGHQLQLIEASQVRLATFASLQGPRKWTRHPPAA